MLHNFIIKLFFSFCRKRGKKNCNWCKFSSCNSKRLPSWQRQGSEKMTMKTKRFQALPRLTCNKQTIQRITMQKFLSQRSLCKYYKTSTDSLQFDLGRNCQNWSQHHPSLGYIPIHIVHAGHVCELRECTVTVSLHDFCRGRLWKKKKKIIQYFEVWIFLRSFRTKKLLMHWCKRLRYLKTKCAENYLSVKEFVFSACAMKIWKD